jgi:hypothetical protein
MGPIVVRLGLESATRLGQRGFCMQNVATLAVEATLRAHDQVPPSAPRGACTGVSSHARQHQVVQSQPFALPAPHPSDSLACRIVDGKASGHAFHAFKVQVQNPPRFDGI